VVWKSEDLDYHQFDGFQLVLFLKRFGHGRDLLSIAFQEENFDAVPMADLVVNMRLDNLLEFVLKPRDRFFIRLIVRDDDDGANTTV
jgi:hypothetical protein